MSTLQGGTKSCKICRFIKFQIAPPKTKTNSSPLIFDQVLFTHFFTPILFFQRIQVSQKFLLTKLNVTQTDWPNSVLTKTVILFSTTTCTTRIDENGHLANAYLLTILVNRNLSETWIPLLNYIWIVLWTCRWMFAAECVHLEWLEKLQSQRLTIVINAKTSTVPI